MEAPGSVLPNRELTRSPSRPFLPPPPKVKGDSNQRVKDVNIFSPLCVTDNTPTSGQPQPMRAPAWEASPHTAAGPWLSAPGAGMATAMEGVGAGPQALGGQRRQAPSLKMCPGATSPGDLLLDSLKWFHTLFPEEEMWFAQNLPAAGGRAG